MSTRQLKTVVSDKSVTPSPDVLAHLPEVGGRYTVCDEIGYGGAARVFIGFDQHLQREVAIKALRPELNDSDEAIRRFLREGAITAKLQHPGVVPVYDIGSLNKQTIFFSMERVQGKTLRTLLNERKTKANGGGYNKGRLVRVIEQVCQIVAYAHSQGIAHRDLKPENIMVGKYNKVYVMDWGIAKDFSSDVSDDSPLSQCMAQTTLDADENLTQPGQAKGTPGYMSPEQAMGLARQVDFRSDVFSLGIVLYEVLSGKNPFQGDSIRETLNAIKAIAPPPLPRSVASRELASICSKALDKTPAERYPTAEPMAEDVRRALDFRPISIQRDNLAAHFFKYARRHTAVSILFVSLCLFSLVIIATRLDENRFIDESLLAKAADHTRAAAELEVQIQAAERHPLDGWQHHVRELHKQYSIENQLARTLLVLALEMRPGQLSPHIRQTLKQAWLAELNGLVRTNDHANARRSLAELRAITTTHSDALVWSDDEQEQLKRLTTLLSVAP